MVIHILHKIFYLKGSNVYELKNQLTILGVYNYREFSLLISIFIYKNSNHLFCYDFKFSQYTHLQIIIKNVSS